MCANLRRDISRNLRPHSLTVADGEKWWRGFQNPSGRGKGGAACVSARVDARSVREAIAGTGQRQRTALCREMRLMPSLVQSSFADSADVAGADGCDAGENLRRGGEATHPRGAGRNSPPFATTRGRVGT